MKVDGSVTLTVEETAMETTITIDDSTATTEVIASRVAERLAGETGPETITPTESGAIVPDHHALVAAAIAELEAATPVDLATPPDHWFDNPNFDAPTPLTITADGQVYGHLATWGTCHTGNPAGPGVCVPPPTSPSNYAYFATGEMLTASGKKVAVGHITYNTGHADPIPSITAARAAAHYDHTGTVGADVAIGEDAHGIWVAGAARTTDPKELRVLRAAALSGDWRPVNGDLELVAALAVNVPGFPIPRPMSLVASGETVALTAANIVRNLEPWEVEMLDLRGMVASLQSRLDDMEQADLLRRAKAAQERSRLVGNPIIKVED